MDFENMNIWCWLIPLLVGVICGIIGYYWGRGSVEVVDNSVELNALREKNAKLKSDLDACNKRLLVTPNGGGTVSSSLGATPAAMVPPTPKVTPAPTALVAFDSVAAKSALGKTVKQDDLKVVEGIGPKIAAMFNESGITTWKALSETSVASCQEILSKGGERYRIHDPASWPMQAKMCYEGKWAELAKWQDEHDHGKL